MLQNLISNIHTSWLLLGVLATLAIIWLWIKSRRPFTKYNIPPYPVKPWPILGHFFHLTGNLRDTFKEWRKLAGDIYSIDIAGQHIILLNGFEVIREVLVKHADNVLNVENNLGIDLLREHDKGIIWARDDNWREQRATSLAIFRHFGVGKNIMAEKIQTEVGMYLEKLASFKVEPANVKILTHGCVSNVVCSIIIGKRFDYDDPNFADLIHHININLQDLTGVIIASSFPLFCHFPGDLLHVKRWTKSAIEINESFSKAYINKLRKSFNEDEEPQNFITAYLQEMKKKKSNGETTWLSEANLVAIIRMLFIAGTETTSLTILWCFVYMLHHPEVQEKLYKEIETHVGTSRVPNMADKPNLTYLNAVIMETQRIASIAPLGFRREIKQSFELGGFTFPKDSIVWPCLDSVLLDEKIWGDPHKFRPERFIDQTGTLIHPEELVPFSMGKRACLGESLARMELFLFISAVFQRFKLEPGDNLPSVNGLFGATVAPFPFKIRLIERKR